MGVGGTLHAVSRQVEVLALNEARGQMRKTDGRAVATVGPGAARYLEHRVALGALQPGPEVVAGPPLFPREVACAARRSDQQPQLARRRDQAALHREPFTGTGAGPGGPTH